MPQVVTNPYLIKEGFWSYYAPTVKSSEPYRKETSKDRNKQTLWLSNENVTVEQPMLFEELKNSVLSKIDCWGNKTQVIRGYETLKNEIPREILKQKKWFSDEKTSDELDTFLEESKILLSFEDDWDDEGANKPNKEAYHVAIHFLKEYFNYISKIYGETLKLPYIDAMPDGSIYLNWDDDVKFLIIFKRADGLSYFYGQNQDQVPFKGAIMNFSEVEGHIAQWMKNYLCKRCV